MSKPRSAAALLLALGLAACSSEPWPVVRMERFWDEVAGAIRPGMSEEQTALLLARWVVANSTNDHRAKSLDGTPFFGSCWQRAVVYRHLARRAGLEVVPVLLADFNGAGHAAVEVRWDGRWHYLDVTYAGYFRVDGEIVSFAELQADPAAALAGMEVFPGTLDRWRDGRAVDNLERMRANYTPHALRSARRLTVAARAAAG